MYRLASMNVYVEGFEYPQPKASIFDLSWHLKTEVYNSGILNQEDIAEINQTAGSDFITPDGSSDGYNHQGTINMYVGNLSPDKIQAVKDLIHYTLDSMNVSYSISGPEQSGLLNSQVFRYNIINNPEADKFQAQPPELNMANATMQRMISGILKLEFNSEGASFHVDVILDRIKNIRSYDIQEFVHETIVDGNMIEPSKDANYWKDRLNTLGKIALWAKQHRFNTLYIV